MEISYSLLDWVYSKLLPLIGNVYWCN